MKCLHLVPLADIIGVTGDKDNLHRVVLPAELSGHSHPVHCSHFNIQKQDVKVFMLGIVKEKFLPGGKAANLEGMPPLSRPLPGKVLYIVSVRFRIVADSHLINHTSTL